MSAAFGVDIGGTKIQFCRIEPDLSVETLERVPTALMRRGTTRFADDLVSLLRARMPRGTTRLAVSLNAIIDRGRVPYSSLMGGRVDFPLEAFLEEQLGIEVSVDDDIHAMTLAEATAGDHAGQPIAMLNLGTGIGVGCHDGTRVLRGRFGAGLISELPVHIKELNGLRSLDRTVCGRGLREMYLEVTGHEADAITIFERARQGDADASKVVDIFTRVLAQVMQMISRFYHPARIVINGSIRLAADDYLERAVALYETGLEGAFRAEISISRLKHAAELGAYLGREYDRTDV